MTNLELIELFGNILNNEALELLEENDQRAVDSWNDDIQEAIDLDECKIEIRGSFTKTGNPALVRF